MEPALLVCYLSALELILLAKHGLGATMQHERCREGALAKSHFLAKLITIQDGGFNG
jgi:hypothetical protein